ncbi:hypothetical protein P153DRAFT_309877 [Dothidotthia symphoricarpi CBS 119687]|uniref:CFEM domain-containing protein n=1 Tax=Dothidotthia symphoricarpi CBS 119687 TaxID=1392245 RepID=A0A6A6AN43_9PLEO|nr:uncharacterized protein P153DRAFT_309877 [Dothidotthia symphoricarpi CBS 119687]KAF2132986.1 hypothetical protein P153DRAFT_309877 [Dothidotthia symphoricarpi CBS 119687]
MKAFQLLLTLLAWATLGLAQSGGSSGATHIPQCAQTCLEDAAKAVACDPTNQWCVCTNTQLQGIWAVCVMQHCTVKEALATRNLTEAACYAPVRNNSESPRVVNIVLCIISCLCVTARFAHKGLFTTGELGADDLTLLLSIAAGLPQVIVIDRSIIPHGLGKDVWNVPPEDIYIFSRGLYALIIAYYLQIALIKLSLLLFLLRIFPRTATKNLIRATMVFDILFGISFALAATFTCTPISFFWTLWDGEHSGKCLDINLMGWINAGVSIGLDVWMLALPLFEVFCLQLSWQRKLSAAFMFFVGTFVTIVSIFRLRFLVDFGSSLNPTWTATNVVLASIIEVNAGIICVCLPSLRIIFVRMFPNILASTHSVSQRTYSEFDTRARASVAGQLQTQSTMAQDSSAIMKTQTFDIQHDDADKAQLVQMYDLGAPSSKSLGTRSSSVGSV